MLKIFCCDLNYPNSISSSKFFSELEFFKDHEKAKARKDELEAQKYLRHPGLVIRRIVLEKIRWQGEEYPSEEREYHCLSCGPSYIYNEVEIDDPDYIMLRFDPEPEWCQICHVGICHVCLYKKINDLPQIAKDFKIYERFEYKDKSNIVVHTFCQECIDKYDPDGDFPGYGNLIKDRASATTL